MASSSSSHSTVHTIVYDWSPRRKVIVAVVVTILALSVALHTTRVLGAMAYGTSDALNWASHGATHLSTFFNYLSKQMHTFAQSLEADNG